MYIILKRSNENEQILNIIYGQDDTIINKWIKEYLEQEIESLKMCPLEENIKSIIYEINEGINDYELIKREKRIQRGYIYNTSDKTANVVFSIKVLQYNSSHFLPNVQSNLQWENINSEINNRVLKQLDKESIYQVFVKLQRAIDTKTQWNRLEYISTISEITKSFRKELYSSIAKKMKRFGKRQILYKNHVPDNFANKEKCKLENNTIIPNNIV
jgi:hypothetical protein